MSSVSIFEHISAHVPDGGPGLTEGGDHLPDEPGPEEKPVRWASGLIDQIVDPGSVLSAEQTAASVLKAFVETAYHSAPAESFERLYQRLMNVEGIGFLEPFVRRVYESRIKRADVRDVAIRLVTGSTDRLPVKTGIALLGICARREDQRLLLTMARHSEFTDYAGCFARRARTSWYWPTPRLCSPKAADYVRRSRPRRSTKGSASLPARSWRR